APAFLVYENDDVVAVGHHHPVVDAPQAKAEGDRRVADLAHPAVYLQFVGKADGAAEVQLNVGDYEIEGLQPGPGGGIAVAGPGPPQDLQAAPFHVMGEIPVINGACGIGVGKFYPYPRSRSCHRVLPARRGICAVAAGSDATDICALFFMAAAYPPLGAGGHAPFRASTIILGASPSTALPSQSPTASSTWAPASASILRISGKVYQRTKLLRCTTGG